MISVLMLGTISTLFVELETMKKPAESELHAERIIKRAGGKVARDDINGRGMVTKVEIINLSQDLSSFDTDCLATFSELRELRLIACSITDERMGFIRKLNKVEILDLGGNEITDAGLAALAHLDTLKVVCLGYNKVTDAGIGSIIQSRGVRNLRLEKTPISGTFLKLMPFPTLERIDLSESKINDQTIRLLKNYQSLRSINLSRCELSDAMWDTIGTLRHVTTFSSTRSRIHGKGISQLKDCKELRSVRISYNNLSRQGLQELATLSQVTDLYIERTGLTDESIQVLSGMKNLKKLWISEKSLTDRAVVSLVKLSKLEELSIPYTRITRNGTDEINRVLPFCKIVRE